MKSAIRLITLIRLGVISSTQIETLANLKIAMLVTVIVSVILSVASFIGATITDRGEKVLFIMMVSLGILAIVLAISSGIVSITLDRLVTEYCVMNGIDITLFI